MGDDGWGETAAAPATGGDGWGEEAAAPAPAPAAGDGWGEGAADAGGDWGGNTAGESGGGGDGDWANAAAPTGGDDAGAANGGRDISELISQVQSATFEDEVLKKIDKNFYRTSGKTNKRADADIDAWRDVNNITVSGNTDKLKKPILTFQEADLPYYVNDLFKKKQFHEPTAVQAQAWPIALSGDDMIAVAKTGSGKTFAFGVPMVMHCRGQPPLVGDDGPIGLVLAPTRELILQIHLELTSLCAEAEIHTLAVFGGQGNRRDQDASLRQGQLHILSATPGRLMDFLANRATHLRRTSYFVLDEADSMLAMGFEEQVRAINHQIRPDKQTLLFSATWPKDVEALSADFQNNPVRINIGYEALAANPNVRQHIWFVGETERQQEMVNLLAQLQDHVSKLLIFTSTKADCVEITNFLRSHKIRAVAFHGDLSQPERNEAMVEFKRSESAIMVATDVAQRGLDIPQLSCVLNFDFPDHLEDYVHRIGRTGRVNDVGDAYTFFTPKDKHHAPGLVSLLEGAKQPVDPFLQKIVEEGFEKPKQFYRYSRPQKAEDWGEAGGDWSGGDKAAAGGEWKEGGDWSGGDWNAAPAAAETAAAPAAPAGDDDGWGGGGGAAPAPAPAAAPAPAPAPAAAPASGGDDWGEWGGGEWKEGGDWGEGKKEEAAKEEDAGGDGW